ncbi:MAG: glycosyltransferase family 2 protein [Anaerolinea sp.]|nr:glycosyltransferase family 2 protein [Anaerolinea sp.]
MRISVALCTYNGEAYLPAQLESIRNQTRLPDEAVFCDDCSRDGTTALLSQFAGSVPFEVSIHRNAENLGSTPNFASAIERCTGDIIVLADQDDVWFPDKLANLEAVFRSDEGIGLAFSDATVVDDHLRPLGYTLWQSVRFSRHQQQQMTQGEALSILLMRPVITGATMAFRSVYRDVVLPIPALWIHDEWIGLQLALRTRLYPLPRSLMHYRQHTANQVGTTGVRWRERWHAAFRTDPRVYQRRAEQYRLLLESLARQNDVSPAQYRQIVEKTEHLEFRGTLPNRHAARLLPILRQLPRYRRYSGSVLNAVRDLLLAHPG